MFVSSETSEGIEFSIGATKRKIPDPPSTGVKFSQKFSQLKSFGIQNNDDRFTCILIFIPVSDNQLKQFFII